MPIGRRPVIRGSTSILTAVAGIILSTLFVALSPSFAQTSAATSPGAVISSLHIVGGPVAAEGAVVVITADSRHNLHIEGIAPNTGKVAWNHPYSESAITPGLAPTVYAIGNTIIDLVPSALPTNPAVNIEGINATTGAIAWSSVLKNVVLSDQPSPCAGKKDLCVIGYNPDGSTTMVILNPATGAVVTHVNGLYRSMDTDVFQNAASDPLIEGLSVFGTVAWSKSVSTLMGSAGYNPEFGWDLSAYGSTEVATIGSTSATSDRSYGLDKAKTVGLSLANGTVAWSHPGQYQCGGTLQFETPAILCLFHGSLSSATRTRSIVRSFKGLTLTLQGVNTASGAITWSVPVRDVNAIGNGKLEFLDARHVLVQLGNGKQAVLNTDDGTTAPVGRNEVFWCTSLTLFKVDESKSLNPNLQRVGGNTFFPCTATGQATTTLPKASPSTVGVTVDGIFVWPSPHGLASRVVGSGQGLA
jgi:outer membrane protein assembly factor BamB